ncbi:prolyl-tRNA synthetase associated domain-containing protein 1-like [Diadema setosum]|uniref:prolyl-tRNA synthetase associated domain-containing protein 1-like n=1 Tax=Diadema setosum TaxID=31175 RepID=UPI003B3AA87F
MATEEPPSTTNHCGRQELLAEFDRLGITHETVEHPEVFTVEAMMPHLKDLTGMVCKNLFLRDKKKKLWLLTALHDRQVTIGTVGKKVGAPNLRFADESILLEKLGVRQGCVTPFALINDKAGDVRFLLDSEIAKGGDVKVYAHPLVNSASTAVSSEDFMKFVRATGHEPILVDFSEMDSAS